ncbi:MAG: hypothetical protein Q4C91_14070 [Eubacteriales bacterium]|nr:hypothetical protein [Eubacteriales bacterium]
MNKREVWDEMIETDEIMGMIKQEGAGYFSKEGKYKIDVGIYLEQLMEERGITRKSMVHRLNLEESYGRKLFGGQRIPTRKILLQCAFILSLDLKETQRLLEIGQKTRLYPRVRYDAAIIHGIEKKMTLDQMNAFLEEIGEAPLL